MGQQLGWPVEQLLAIQGLERMGRREQWGQLAFPLLGAGVELPAVEEFPLVALVGAVVLPTWGTPYDSGAKGG